jgi:hypothetical protein
MLMVYSSEMADYGCEDQIEKRKQLLIELDAEALKNQNHLLIKNAMIFLQQIMMPIEADSVPISKI